MKSTRFQKSTALLLALFLIISSGMVFGIPASVISAAPLTDEAFAQQLSAFPTSYHAGLVALHNLHPAWSFTPLNTGYDWNYVLDNQEGKNAVWLSYPTSQRSLSATSVNGYGPSYLPDNDTFYRKDGVDFYYASRQTIAYYMDPRNFLVENQSDTSIRKGGSVFMFENLGYNSSQTLSGIETILSGTFMSSANTPVVNYFDTNGILQTTGKTYAQIIMEAAVYSGASAYFIAARMRMEIGVNPSDSVSGTFFFTGPTGVVTNFTGLYNYFNVYASDDPFPGQNVANGLKYARGDIETNQTNRDTFMLPWTSPVRSIMGGARYLAENYIRKGQDTLYLQKFSVNPSYPLNFCRHQYMSSVHAPSGESRSVYATYTNMGILGNEFQFVIPVYNNMPDAPVQLATENANNIVTDLYVSGGELSPGFAYNNMGVYQTLVDGSYGIVSISGRKEHVTSSISIGSKTYVTAASNTRNFSINVSLALGENNIPLTVTAQNGASRTYNLRIYRGIPTAGVPGFVYRLYQVCLGRIPSSVEFGSSGWVESLQSGQQTGAQVSYGFVFSDELKNRNLSDADYVRVMYRTFLNREPDAGGFNGWLSMLSNGMSRYYILAGFINSIEFNELCKSYGINAGSMGLSQPADLYPQITAFTTRLYKLCLGRMPDPTGLNGWVDTLQSGKGTAMNVAYGFVFSNEFLNRNVNNSDFVAIMYRTFLNREADPVGYAGWVNALNNGTSRQSILAGFVNSLEFNALCRDYGISRVS